MISLRTLSTCSLTVCALALFAGCGSKKDDLATYEEAQPPASTPDDHDHDHGHEHVHAAPHGGTLIELGEHEYNAEVVVDEKAHRVQIYLLGAHAESAQPIAQSEITLKLNVDGESQEYKLTPKPLENDPEGLASLFEITDEKLVETLEQHEDAVVGFEVSVDGKQYNGSFQHGEHDHDHGDHDHAGHEHPEGGHQEGGTAEKE